MKKSIFRRIFLGYAFLIILAMLFTELYITKAVREDHLDNLKQSLAIQEELISGSISFNHPNLDNICKHL